MAFLMMAITGLNIYCIFFLQKQKISLDQLFCSMFFCFCFLTLKRMKNGNMPSEHKTYIFIAYVENIIHDQFFTMFANNSFFKDGN